MTKTQNYSLGFLLTKVGRIATKMYADRLEDLGLTPLQAGILATLAGGEGLSQKELIAALHVDKGTIHTMLRGLEKKKWITMKTSAGDKRHLQILLSKTGRALLPGIAAIDREVSAQIAAPIPAPLRKHLSAALLEAYRAFEN